MLYKTCASIAEKTPTKIKKTLSIALKKSDYAEIRFDFLNPDLVPDTLNLIKKDLKKNCLYVKADFRRWKFFRNRKK